MTIRKKIKTGSISPLLPDVIPAQRIGSKTKIVHGRDKYKKPKAKTRLVRSPSEAWASAIDELAAGKPNALDLKVAQLKGELKPKVEQPKAKVPKWPFPDQDPDHPTNQVATFSAGMSRTLNGPRDGPAVTLRLRDAANGAFIEIPLTVQQLGAMVAGDTMGTVDVTLFGIHRLGTKRERKTIKVFTKLGYTNRDAKARKLGEAKCPEGWTFAGPGLGGSSWSQSDSGFDQERKKDWIKLHYVRWVK